jgi:methionine synthase / methylenetetrahydrofolate reductase(NADPH)
MNLLDELQERVVCGDGAMGTLLLDQGLPMESCLEEVCVSDPERVQAIHRDYIAAGARVIETNTFGANAARLSRFGFENRVSEFNRAAAKLAKETAAGKDICVAGSVGPLGISALESGRARNRSRPVFPRTDPGLARRRRGPDFSGDVHG